MLMSTAPVLIVDPNLDGLELYSTALALEGIASLTATSADEALRRFEAAAPKVLVTGLRLPGTGGADLIRRVRRAAPASQVFIVALSTNADVETRHAQDAGCNLVLPVPCSPERLVGALRRALM
jgi:CheY-like chemotaxis protein